MKTIVIYADGTLGDHLPNIALGQALVARGYRVRMAINQAMHPYAARAGLEAVALTDVERGPAEARKNAWAWNHWRDPATARPADFVSLGPDDYVTQARDLIELCRGADLLLATSIRILGFVAHQATGIPWITVSLNPSTFLPPASAEEQRAVQERSRREYAHFKDLLTFMFRQLNIRGDVPDWHPGVLFARHVLLGCSAHFSRPNVEQFQPRASLDLAGFWFYQDPEWANWQPDAALARFCERQPLALSFSSQPLEDRRATLAKHVYAALQLERPLLVQRGWADFSEDDLPADANPEDILFVDFIPHDWLFAHVAGAIQHGGIGSIARALRQGCPLLIEPYGNDQFFNANRVRELGVGAALSPFRSTVNDVASVLGDYVLSPGCRQAAHALGAELAKEDGLTTACDMIERYLNRFDAQGHLPTLYDRYTPPLTPRKRQAAGEARAAGRSPENAAPPAVAGADKPLTRILFYHRPWGQPLGLEALSLPSDCHWTTDRRSLPQVDGVVFHLPDLHDLSEVAKPPGQIWIAWSKECEARDPRLRDPEVMRRFDLTMTYRRDSDVPDPYYAIEMLEAFRSPPHPKTETAPAALFLSSSFDESHRLEYLAELMRHLSVHSYGRRLKNTSLAGDEGRASKLAVIARHKFTLAFENAIAPDYVTEKFFDPLLVGSVPVYLGAPNVGEFAPGEHCFVHAADFASPGELANYLLALDADDAAYAAYLAWRSQPLRADFVRMLEAVREHWFVRLSTRVRALQAAGAGRAIGLPIPSQTAAVTPNEGQPSMAGALGEAAIPKILHQTWKDKDVPPACAAFRQTWRTHHPDWELKLWTDTDNREFIREHYEWFLPIYDGYPEPTMRSDAVRYFILYHYGGVYADLDVECLRPLDPLLVSRELVFALEHPASARTLLAKSRGLDEVVGNAVMASTAKHPFWDHVFKQLVGFHRAPSPLDATGPFFLTRACQTYAHREHISVALHQWIYPISNDKPWASLPPELQTLITQTAYTIRHRAGRERPEAGDQPAAQAKVTLLAQGQAIHTATLSVDRCRAALAAGPSLPKISCLMVTRDRAAWAQRAIHCFRQQTYANRELVIVDDSPNDALEASVAQLGDPRIVYKRLPDDRRSLGELRNQALSLATGDYVAQWDDDDLSDPVRLDVQMSVIYALQCDACFLERQQILWLASRRLAVSTRRVWEGSFLCAKGVLPPYPAQRRGEDTPVIEEIVRRRRVAWLDLPRLYTYVYHGGNTFDEEHWESFWLTATESYEGPLFDSVLQGLQERLKLALEILPRRNN